MTDEDRKAKVRERMRRYRLRHKNDPVFKARVREEKRKQLAKHSPERRKAAGNARAKRYREKHKDDFAFKAKAAARTAAWREKNPERGAEARAAWGARNRDKHAEYLKNFHAKNPEYNVVRSREYTQAHVEELKAYRRSPQRKQRLKEYKIERPAITTHYARQDAL